MRRLLWCLAITVAFVCYQAEADTASPVITCAEAVSGQPYAACTAPTQTNIPASSTLTLFCSSGAADFAPRDSCATQTWLRYGDLQSYSWVLTAAGWQRAGNIVAGSTPPPPP